MEIPIKISVPDNTREVAENLMGLGEKITDPELLKYFGEDARSVNKSVNLCEGVVLGQPSVQKMQKAMESFHAEQWFDWNLALFITDKLLTIGVNTFVIAESLLSRLKSTQFKIELNGKEITTKDELQKTLDEYIQSNTSEGK